MDDTPKVGRVEVPKDDAPKADDGPRGSGPKVKAPKKDSKPSSKPAGRPPGLERQITEFFFTLGMLYSPINGFDGAAVMSAAEANGKAHANMCQKNKRYKELWERMLEVSSIGEIVGATAQMVIPIMINHNVIPPNIPTPDDWPKPPIQVHWMNEQKKNASSNGN